MKELLARMYASAPVLALRSLIVMPSPSMRTVTIQCPRTAFRTAEERRERDEARFRRIRPRA